MAVLLDNNADLAWNGWLGKTSGGTYVAVIASVIASNGIVAYTDIFGTPTLIGVKQTGTIVHGGGSVARIAACMDSADVIHVASMADTLQTRDCAYNTISDPDSSPAWGTWEEAGAHDQPTLPDWDVAITVDSNDAPHILYTNYVKTKGTPYTQIQYVEKTGASWSSAVQVNAVGDNNYRRPKLTIKASDELEAIYYNESNGDLYYNSTSGGSWGTESSYADTGARTALPSPLVTTGGTVYRIHHNTAGDIKENGVDSTYNTIASGSLQVCGGVLVEDADRYVFYIDGSADVHLIVNDGSWADKGALVTGTYEKVIPSWQYLNDNLVDEIIYMYEEDGNNDVYVESYNLAERRIFITHV